ncbi:adenylate/guanylate cyclase domain-containing protein [Undibacterium griseum]|uniref:Adenylate/guanylate cyclase domain-containing protein n=1 Tax=Undibacterium griseum TaxID=2762295 RepID=A0ABR6YJS6_9BURK|nr:adenylate/guanylate cyclase domain-containing protein [Undibacterium griseum]MBC3884108.1 adenylate/guanylate cyclase domain-containing protein [Undibacterium griseum]
MALRDDLHAQVAKIFREVWTMRDGQVVPANADVGLGNDAVKLNATVLYADLADSTLLVDRHIPAFAAEVYKTFLHCAAKIIVNEGGEITAYDGDRVMAVFLGHGKNVAAIRAAMQINFVVKNVIAPTMAVQYNTTNYTLKHVIGVDTSDLFVARTGVRGANDLVWVGRAANHAAKLAALPDTYQTYVTKAVFDQVPDFFKYSEVGAAIWEPATWNTFDNSIVYRTTWGQIVL